MAEAKLVIASRIVTHHGSDAEAMLVVGERVAATGSTTDMRRLAPSAEEWDYTGCTVVPGFNDAHQHLTMMATQRHGLDLSAPHLNTREALAHEIRRRAVTLPPQNWLVAHKYDHVRSSEGRRLTCRELDELVGARPAILVHIGAHWGVANSAALARAGLDEESLLAHGGEIGRDAHGRLDGFISEQALFDFVYPSLATQEPVVPPPPHHDLVQAVLTCAQALLASGITSVTDAMVGPAELGVLQDARQAGLPLRVNALLTFPHLPAMADLGLRDGFGDEWLRIGGIKAFVDGAVAGRSCAVAEPFADSHDDQDKGILTVQAAELQDLVNRATDARTRLAIHANGERAIDMVLDAVESAEQRSPGELPLRHRIEHCSIITPHILERMSRLRIIAVPFGSYAYFHGENILTWYGTNRAERMFAHRSMLDADITVAGSSDYPCGPWEPLLGLQSCVTRRSRSGLPVGLSQRISLREAIHLYTVGSAAASGEDHLKGRLAPGYLADLTVLEAEIFDLDPESLGTVSVAATWVGGVPRWQSAAGAT